MGTNADHLLVAATSRRQFYVAPGYGSCEFNYTDADPGVCLNPGWVRSAHANGCNKW